MIFITADLANVNFRDYTLISTNIIMQSTWIVILEYLVSIYVLSTLLNFCDFVAIYLLKLLKLVYIIQLKMDIIAKCRT